MRLLKKALKWSSMGVAGLAGVLTLAVVILEHRSYDAPLPDIHASADPALIARGRYLVYGAAHCVDCHGDSTRRAGNDIPLSGGHEFKLPIGTIRTPNLTADRETGIAAMSDGQIARALRFGVGRDGRALAPFMPFADLSDDDLAAIVSFLRSQPPVRNPVRIRSLNPLGHAVAAFALRPQGPSRPTVRRVEAGPTVEYGRYLVHSVANCAGCHTQRNLRTGAFTGPVLAGGFHLHENGIDFVTPNLTDDAKTGRIANWTEEIFVARFKMGKGADGSPMPWASFGRLRDDDLRAVYRYLKTVPGVENDTGDSVRAIVATK
jgi:mono/diheme cytochrome c family protein